MLILTYPPPPPAALTLARRLERAGLGDNDLRDRADYDQWLATLHAYEQIMDREAIMATFQLQARQIDANGAVTVSEDTASDAALETLLERLGAFRAHGDIAREMIAALGRQLDAIAALPVEAANREAFLKGWWLRFRYGQVPRVLPPGSDWRWPDSLQGWEMRAWHEHAINCRQLVRALPERQLREVEERYGALRDRDGSDWSLWRIGWPQAEMVALDKRATTMIAALRDAGRR